jgi:hypothetical protein
MELLNGVYQRRRHDHVAQRSELNREDTVHRDDGRFMPAPPLSRKPPGMLDPRPLIFRFRLHAWRRDLGNFALIKHRRCDGHLLSMHQSGTHWLKFMLANALSHQYGTPPPEYNHANDIIGGPKDLPRYPQLPRIISSHTIAHPLLRYTNVHRLCRLPRYVVLVRDLRAALVANFVKWQDAYGVSFPDYLAGDPRGRRYNSDIWWALRFLNAWGEVVQRVPERVTVIRYETLERDAPGELERIARRLDLDLSPADIEHGVAVSTRALMQEKDDPRRPPGAVRSDTADPGAFFDPAGQVFVQQVVTQCLRHDFGYDYARW